MERNLVSGLMEQIERVGVIRSHAVGIGSAGAFLVAMIDLELSTARKALSSGDIIAMVLAYKSLKEIQE